MAMLTVIYHAIAWRNVLAVFLTDMVTTTEAEMQLHKANTLFKDKEKILSRL